MVLRLQTVPALANRIRSTPKAGLEAYVFGPAERMLTDPDQTDFNAQIDVLVKAGVQVTTASASRSRSAPRRHSGPAL